MVPRETDVTLKTFNTAKLFAEKILFPKMDLFQLYQRQADFGSFELDKAANMPEEIRDIERFNGLKGMTETVYNLLVNITSTVRLKGNKEENKMLDHLTDKIKQVRQLFYENKKRFFISGVSNMNMVEKLDRDYFEIVKDMVNKFYINTEILMTRNKLLFADANDDYLGDKEILDQIKNEYIEN